MKETGMLLLVEAPLLILGLIELFKRRREKRSKVIGWWILCAPLPATIGFDAPHAIRALQVLPALILVAAVGFNQIRKYKIWLWLLVFINAGYFAYHYFRTYPTATARDWQYGYKEAAAVASEWEDRVDKVIISSYYGQAYVFTYWYQDRDPQAIFWGGAIKYLFRAIRLNGDLLLPNTLLIGAPEEIPASTRGIIRELYFPDGKVAFRVVKT
jgi:hypothetical protein